ncbi:MAG: ribosome silencing factor [Alphaproteobacteria bacterium]|jgi:ribosome-associated protein|nr:ribosome silencing factor [Alphaproteobacteria bacterium]
MNTLNKQEINDLKTKILENLDESKAKDVLAIDLDGKSDLCSYMIIASGTSDRHVMSIAEKLILELKQKNNEVPYSAEGVTEGKWALIDTSAIAVHVFHPEVREYYDLESLWYKPNSRNKLDN